MFRNSVIGVALMALVASAGAAAAQQPTSEAGFLACRGTTQTYGIASTKELKCLFRRYDGTVFRYNATVYLGGIDLGAYQNVAIDWAVFAPTRRVGPADLVGDYGGISAGGAIGLGIGANALIGGSNNTIALNPLSGEAKTGWGIWAGFSRMELRSADEPRRRRRHR